MPATAPTTPQLHPSASLRPASSLDPRAEPPRAPAPSAAVRKARGERAVYLQARERRESRSILRGLVLLALLALAISLVRAGADRAFFTGWWQHW